MKLSVSLPAEDVDYLDEYSRTQGLGSRSAAVQKAVRLLRASALGVAYEEAWSDWAEGDDAMVWDEVVGDGIS